MATFVLTEVRVFKWVPCWLLARLELVPVATCVPAGLVPPMDCCPLEDYDNAGHCQHSGSDISEPVGGGDYDSWRLSPPEDTLCVCGGFVGDCGCCPLPVVADYLTADYQPDGLPPEPSDAEVDAEQARERAYEQYLDDLAAGGEPF